MKKNFTGVLALSMTAVVAMGTFAFADDVASKEAVSNEEISDQAVSNDEEVAEITYMTKEDVISSVEKTEEGTQVFIGDNVNGFFANVDNSVKVINAEDGSFMTLDDLKEGMEVLVLLDENAPMTMSLPPMTNGVKAIVVKAEGKTAALYKFDMSLVSEDKALELNIGDETKITDINGGRKIYTEADVKGATALVIYGASTKSIPAQTAPDSVIILKEAETEIVGLRYVAEKAGYTVTWTNNDEPVLIVKGDVTIKAECNSAVVEKTDANGETDKTVLKETIYLQDGKMMTSSDISALFE